MFIRERRKKFYRSIFRRVISEYYEIRSVCGQFSVEGLYARFDLPSYTGASGFTPRVIRMFLSDFLCDVEKAAKDALSEQDHNFFKLVFLEENPEGRELLRQHLTQEVFQARKHEIQEQVGLVLHGRGLYPAVRYLRSKDLR